MCCCLNRNLNSDYSLIVIRPGSLYNLCCTKSIARFNAARPWLNPTIFAAYTVGSTSGASGSIRGSCSTSGAAPGWGLTLPLPLPRSLCRGAEIKTLSRKDCSTPLATSVAGASRVLHSHYEKTTKQVKTQQGPDITLKSRSKDITIDIYYPNYRSSVRRDTKYQPERLAIIITALIPTLSRPELHWSMTGAREWEYIKYPKPIVSLKNFFAI